MNANEHTMRASAVVGQYISKMDQDLITKTSLIHGYAYTVHPKPDDIGTKDWFDAVRLFHVEQGHICTEVLAYYNSDRDPLTCPYHLLGVPGENAEWGVEVKWHSR